MNRTRTRWSFDEYGPVGVDYCTPEQAAAYDAMHQRFRRYEAEAAAILGQLHLDRRSAVIDMGAGTGAFAIHAAPHVKEVYAVDVSRPMLARCREKARKAGLRNVQCRAGGFLTYRHQAAPADAMVSVAALHHLPDFWKQVGLRRAGEMLRKGGRLYLFDIVFPGAALDLDGQIRAWLQSIRGKAGPRLATEAEVHLQKEHSTYDWVMEGLLRRAGFHINRRRIDHGFQATYLCTRI